jgi:hypothetical protein
MTEQAQNHMDTEMEKTGETPKVETSVLPKSGPVEAAKSELESTGVTLGLMATGGVVPRDITLETWEKIADNTNLLRGLTFYPSDHNQLEPAKNKLFKWKPNLDFYINCVSSATLETEKFYSMRETRNSHNGLVSVQVSAAGGFFGVSIEAKVAVTKREDVTRDNKISTLGTTTRINLPRAQIILERCTELLPDFEKDIREALASSDKFKLLNGVFNNYGYFYRPDFVIGGRVFSESFHENVETSQEKITCEEDEVAFKLKYNESGVESQVKTDTKNEVLEKAKILKESMSLALIGGETAYFNELDKWAETVRNNPELWAVMEVNDIRPTVDLLPEELRKDVKQILDTKLIPQQLFVYRDSFGIYSKKSEGSHEFSRLTDIPNVVFFVNYLDIDYQKPASFYVWADSFKNQIIVHLGKDTESESDRGEIYKLNVTSIVIPKDDVEKVQGGYDNFVRFTDFNTKNNKLESKFSYNFPIEFNNVPKVITNLRRLTAWDKRTAKNLAIGLYTSSVSSKGYITNCVVWGNSQIKKADDSWIAVDGKFSLIQIGLWNFWSPAYAGDPLGLGKGPGEREIAQYITFEKEFDDVPEVIVGLSGFSTTTGANIRIEIYPKDITEKGFWLMGRTWGDSLFGEVHTNWIAIDKGLINI